jgi:hypothetical protein
VSKKPFVLLRFLQASQISSVNENGSKPGKFRELATKITGEITGVNCSVRQLFYAITR